MPLLLPQILRIRLFPSPNLYFHLPAFNPMNFITPLVVLTLSVPFFLFAIITSYFAFLILALRAGIVYLQLGCAIIISWASIATGGIGSGTAAHNGGLETFYKRQQAATMEGRRRRKSHPYPCYTKTPIFSLNTPSAPSQLGTAAATSHTTSIPANFRGKAKSTSTSYANLHTYNTHPHDTLQTSTATLNAPQPDLSRDYEGVGGWRLPTSPHAPVAPPNSDDDRADAREDAVWMSFNSRLELPTPGACLPTLSPGGSAVTSAVTSGQATPRPGQEGQRHHRRSLTTLSQRFAAAGVGTGMGVGLSGQGSRPISPEAFRMSALDSRAAGSSQRSISRVRSSTERAVAADSRQAREQAQEQAEGGYFTVQAEPQLSVQGWMSPEEVVTKERIDARRRSISTGGRSQSSGSSGSRVMTGVGMAMGMSAVDAGENEG